MVTWVGGVGKHRYYDNRSDLNEILLGLPCSHLVLNIVTSGCLRG